MTETILAMGFGMATAIFTLGIIIYIRRQKAGTQRLGRTRKSRG